MMRWKHWVKESTESDAGMNVKHLRMTLVGINRLNLMPIWLMVLKISHSRPNVVQKDRKNNITSLCRAENRMAFQALLVAEFGCIRLNIGQLNLWMELSEQFVSGRISKVGQ